MDRWIGKVGVLTGGSTTIGLAVSRALVEKGVEVVGISRKIERIEELSKKLLDQPGRLYPLKCDVRREDDIIKSFKWINDNIGPISILINNAGIMKSANLTEGNTDDWRIIFDVNVLAVCICTREAIKIMKQHHIHGHVINMNSLHGHYVNMGSEPLLTVYPASKFAVRAITDTLRQELKQFGRPIKVTSISPGIVRNTDDVTVNGNDNNVPSLKPEDIAEAILYVLGTGPNVQVEELMLKPLS